MDLSGGKHLVDALFCPHLVGMLGTRPEDGRRFILNIRIEIFGIWCHFPLIWVEHPPQVYVVSSVSYTFVLNLFKKNNHSPAWETLQLQSLLSDYREAACKAIEMSQFLDLLAHIDD